MGNIKDKKKEVYERLYNFYKHTINSSQYTKWIDEARQAWDFYDGVQWTPEEIKQLERAGQPPVVVNHIAPRIDAAVGQEVQTRTRVAFAPRTLHEDDYLTAKALSAAAQQIQEMNDAGEIKREAFKSALICGVGGVEISSDNDDTPVDIELVRFNEVIYDVDDRTPTMNESQYRGVQRIVDIDDLKSSFPEAKDDIERIVNDHKKQTNGALQLDNEAVNEDIMIDIPRNKIKVVRLQYKKPTKVWRYVDESGKSKEVDLRSIAEKNAVDKKIIQEIEKNEIWEGWFIKDLVLAHYKAKVQTGEFSIQLFVYKRRAQDGVPYGVVKAAIDPQKEVNKRRSKMLHILNNRQIIADTNAFEDIEHARNEASRPDGVLLKRRGTEVQLRDNLGLAESQFRVMNSAINDIQAATGIYDEFLGIQTNARSGIAIAQRAQGSARTQAPTLDRLRFFNKQFGRALLSIMQATLTTNFLVNVTDEETAQAVILNEVVERDGKKHIIRDVSTIEMDVVVVEEPDNDVPADEMRAVLTQLLGNGQVNVLSIPAFARIFVPKYAKEVSEGVQQLLGASQPQQSVAADAPTQPAGGNTVA